MATTYWAPNQASISQVETYTFTAPSGVGNTYTATLNGKTVTYSSVASDTAALAATALFNLLNAPTAGIAAEFTEITFANPSSGVLTATARVAGTPFANVTGTTAGLVMSTGNGLANGIATVHTKANASPSDVNDAQNWLRVIGSAAGVRALPTNGDDVVIANTSTPLLWNLDQLKLVQFNTYTRWQSFQGTIGLPEANVGGYTEWRATYFTFLGPQGSVPAGGLQMVLGQGTTGSGPTRERYNLQSSQYALTILSTGSPDDDYAVRMLGVHTANTFALLGNASLGLAMFTGEVSNVSSSSTSEGTTLGVGQGVTWSAASTLTMLGGDAVLNAAPATLTLSNGARASIGKDLLTWTTVTMQGGSSMNWLAGGTITTLTMRTGSTLDKSADARTLTITNSTIDGDSCSINDPLNSTVFTNATSVKEQVTSGPIRFTGTRTVKVT